MRALPNRSALNVRRLLLAAGAITGEPPKVDLELAGLARSEGLAPLLGARLRRRRLAASNPEIDHQLRQQHRQTTAFNLLLEARLRPLLRALAEHQVPTLALKGVALVETVYGDPGRRPMGDADLLVPAEHWQEALVAVRQAGGKIEWSRQRPLTARRFHEVHVDVGQAVVDLHRQVHDPRLFAVDHDGLFERATAASSYSGLLLPEATDLLLSLATHAAQDGFFVQLRSVVDSLLLIAGGEVDTVELVRRARHWRARKASAIWLRALIRLGLDDPDYRHAADELDPGRRLVQRARQVPYRAERLGPATVRRQKWQLATALDGLHRPLIFFFGRAFWRIADGAAAWGHRERSQDAGKPSTHARS